MRLFHGRLRRHIEGRFKYRYKYHWSGSNHKREYSCRSKDRAPTIEEPDLVRMATQAQQAISMGKTNTKLLGELQCIVFYHKFITVMLFPLDTFHVLAVGVGRIKNAEQLAFRIKELLKGY
jgi:hypothetical protein